MQHTYDQFTELNQYGQYCGYTHVTTHVTNQLMVHHSSVISLENLETLRNNVTHGELHFPSSDHPPSFLISFDFKCHDIYRNKAWSAIFDLAAILDLIWIC